MKRVLSVFLSILIIIAVTTIPVIAAETSTPAINSGSIVLDADSKLTFSKQMDLKYTADLKSGKIKRGTIDEIQNLMMQSTFATGQEAESINEILASYGIYKYEPPTSLKSKLLDDDLIGIMSQNGDVNVIKPSVYYEAWEQTWTITFGGNWKNNNWTYDRIGVGNIGNVDGYGVGFTNVTKPYTSYVVRQYAYITDQDNNYTVSTTNRSDGDGSLGFGFRLQDYIYQGLIEGKYVGYKWYGSCTYNSSFGSYSGLATSYYIHTWSNAVINSIGFNASTTGAGLVLGITNAHNSFPAYSTDTPFGVYP